MQKYWWVFNKIFVGERALKYPDFPHPKEVIETIKKLMESLF